jgi:hypothetical protein
MENKHIFNSYGFNVALSNFCFHDLKAYVSIFETREKNVQVKLLSIIHRCPSKKRDKSRLVEELERTVFNQLRR